MGWWAGVTWDGQMGKIMTWKCGNGCIDGVGWYGIWLGRDVPWSLCWAVRITGSDAGLLCRYYIRVEYLGSYLEKQKVAQQEKVRSRRDEEAPGPVAYEDACPPTQGATE